MQKTAWEITKYSRNETILKIGHRAKATAFAKWSVWVKNYDSQKHGNNDSLTTLELFCAKNRLRKHQIFEKSEDFENRPSCKAYSLCKMISLGQKLRFTKTSEKRFFNHIRVFLCKKALQKTPNIRGMRRFWKSAIVQRLQPLQNGQFGSKIEIHKNMRKTIL